MNQITPAICFPWNLHINAGMCRIRHQIYKMMALQWGAAEVVWALTVDQVTVESPRGGDVVLTSL